MWKTYQALNYDNSMRHRFALDTALTLSPPMTFGLSSFESSRTDMFLVVSSRTELDDDVVDVTSFSALDVVAIKDMFLVVVVVAGARRSQPKTDDCRHLLARTSRRVTRKLRTLKVLNFF